jgi:hypothetical protein
MGIFGFFMGRVKKSPTELPSHRAVRPEPNGPISIVIRPFKVHKSRGHGPMAHVSPAALREPAVDSAQADAGSSFTDSEMI